jgi:hypothetical protein
VLSVAPAARSAYRAVVSRSCSTRLVAHSVDVVTGPSQAGSGPHCNACDVTVFMINRSGHPLIYLVY